MNISDISVYIPTKNESLHIERAISSALEITPYVYVVDSSSTDDTVFKANRMNLYIFCNKIEDAEIVNLI